MVIQRDLRPTEPGRRDVAIIGAGVSGIYQVKVRYHAYFGGAAVYADKIRSIAADGCPGIDMSRRGNT